MGKHNQWFYFSIKNAQPNVSYKFNILNLSKPGSQFNNGMQPVVYSLANPIWQRSGDSVFYIKYNYNNYRNHYRKSDINGDCPLDANGNVSETNTYASLFFTMSFKTSDDTYYIAYHYPYTYSELQRFLHRLNRNPTFHSRCRRSTLCQTLGGNQCPLLTITEFDSGKRLLTFR